MGRPTEDVDPDGWCNARRNNERSTEDGWIDAGLDAQRDLERSCPFFAEQKEINEGTNRRSRSDALIRRSHRRSPSSLTFFSSSKAGSDKLIDSVARRHCSVKNN